MARKKSWRPKSSYLAKTPEAKARQKAGLEKGNVNRWRIKKEVQAKISKIDIMTFATDPEYLGLSFKKRPAQEVILRVLYGLPLDEKQKEIFSILTKNKGHYKPGEIKDEAVLALGARAGKSFLASICAIYEATRGIYKRYLDTGEIAYICIIATRELQARKIIQENCLRMLNNSPTLKKYVVKSTDLEITLKGNVKIISGPCNSTALRGLPIAVLILDEIAFYRIEGPLADDLIFNSLRPRQAQFPNNKLFLISTAGAKQGLFFNFFNQGFRVPGRLTCQASTEFVNPLIPIAFLEKEKDRDIDNYMREFAAEFSEKIEAFFSFEMMQRPFVLAGDLPYNSEFTYCLSLDQSGLSGKDRFALSIGHKEDKTAIIDCVRSWETKNLNIILDEIKTLAQAYFITTAIIDRYSKGYVEAAFAGIGLEVKIRPSLAEVFVVLKGLMIKDNLKLPDRPDLKAGLRNTIAVYNKSNQLAIYHERGQDGHADEIDSVAGCVNEIFQAEPEPYFYAPAKGPSKADLEKIEENSWEEFGFDDFDRVIGPLE